MNTGMKVVLAMMTFMMITVGAIGLKIWTTHDHFIAMEETIKGQYTQNKNNYDSYYKTMTEIVQVNDMYRDDFKKVYDGLMQGRYGKDGSKAMMQWIQENMPNFDSSLYTKVQNTITAGRKDFEMNQKTLIDKKQAYQTSLKTLFNSPIAKLWGFPKIDLEKYDIVTSERTEDAFNKKRDKPLKLR